MPSQRVAREDRHPFVDWRGKVLKLRPEHVHPYVASVANANLTSLSIFGMRDSKRRLEGPSINESKPLTEPSRKRCPPLANAS
jgi:hypothetical protein